MPVDKDKKYLLNRLNNATVIYKKGQTRVAKSNSAANNIINDFSQNLNPEQIKSVDNQGSFDEGNANIYYQTSQNNSQEILKQKYLNEKQNALKNFYDVHKDFTENEPEQYNGERTIKAVLSYLGSQDNKKASVKSPIENITITRNDVKHLIIDNEKERAIFIDRFVKTLQNPNLIVGSFENGKEYNYYIKLFKQENQKLSGHVQIIKKCEDGNFYVTNYHLRNNKLNTILKNGQIKYDLSDLSAVQNAPDNSIINDNSQNINPVHSQKRTGYVLEQPYSSQPNLFTESASERLGDNSENLYVQPKNSYRGRAVLDKQLILVTATGDVSTVVHEYAHWYLGILQDAEGYSDKVFKYIKC